MKPEPLNACTKVISITAFPPVYLLPFLPGLAQIAAFCFVNLHFFPFSKSISTGPKLIWSIGDSCLCTQNRGLGAVSLPFGGEHRNQFSLIKNKMKNTVGQKSHPSLNCKHFCGSTSAEGEAGDVGCGWKFSRGNGSTTATEVTAKLRQLVCRGNTSLLIEAAIWTPGSIQQYLLACPCSPKCCFLHENE